MIKFLLLFIVPFLISILGGRNSISRNNKKLLNNSTLLTEPILKSLTQRLSNILETPQIPVWIHEVNVFNGLATSEGKIFLTRGALDAFYSGTVTAEELSSIIAHELGHVALGHSRRRMIDFTMQNALRVVLSFAISRFIPALGTYIANLVISLVASKLSRKDEYEADAYAAALLSKAGIGTTPQINLLRKLEALSKNDDVVPEWLMSHPKTSDRIMAITNLTEKWYKTN